MGITPETYFEQDEYMSVSALKKLIKCEVDGLVPFGEMSPSMLIGSYVDAYVEGTLDKFVAEHPEIISSKGASKGELKAEFKQAEEICRFIDNDSKIQQFLSGDKQTILTGEIEGVPFKIKMDAYSKGIAINDLKIMRSVTDSSGEFYDFISQWGYDIQLACYQEVERQNSGQQLPCFIVALTKETPINSVIIMIPQHILDKALARISVDIKHYYDIKMGQVAPVGCGKCKSCISLRKETPLISMDEFFSS